MKYSTTFKYQDNSYIVEYIDTSHIHFYNSKSGKNALSTLHISQVPDDLYLDILNWMNKVTIEKLNNGEQNLYHRQPYNVED